MKRLKKSRVITGVAWYAKGRNGIPLKIAYQLPLFQWEFMHGVLCGPFFVCRTIFLPYYPLFAVQFC